MISREHVIEVAHRALLERWLAMAVDRHLPVAATNATDQLRALAANLKSGDEVIDDRATSDGVNTASLGGATAIEDYLLSLSGASVPPTEKVEALAGVILDAFEQIRTADDVRARRLADGAAKVFVPLLREVYENDLTPPDCLAEYLFDADQPDAAWLFYDSLRGKPKS